MKKAALLALYYGLLVWLARGMTLDYWDSFVSLMNALCVAGIRPEGFQFEVSRPPTGWLLLLPGLVPAYRSGGPGAALEVCRLVMPLAPVALVWTCGRVYRKLYPPVLAGVLVLLLAANPAVVRYSPFALFDLLSALATLPFLWAALRFLEKPGAKNWAVALAALVLLTLTRYHLLVVAAGPLAYALLTPGRRRSAPALAALIPAAAAACVFVLAALAWLAGSPAPLERAWRGLRDYVLLNASGHAVESSAIYLAALLKQLGYAGAGALALGVSLWLRGSARERYAAYCLVLPLFALHFAAAKEQRYVLAFLPLIYAAVGRGLAAFCDGGLARARWATPALLALALAPWGELRRSIHFLRQDYAMRSSVPYQLGERIGARKAAWVGGDLTLWRTDSYTEEQLPVIGRTIMPLFGVRLAAPRASVGEAGDAEFVVEVLESRAPGAPLGRLWAREGRALKHEANIFSAGLLPAR